LAWGSATGAAFGFETSTGAIGKAPKAPTGMFGASQVAYSGDGTWAALYHQATAGGGNTALLMLPTGPSTKAVLGTDTNINMVGAANGFVVGSLQNGAPRVALYDSSFGTALPETVVGGVPVVAHLDVAVRE